ncbi:MAG TPA: hypothetical protein VF719_03035, partial [Abditibacteriaceae bacterium]
MKSKMPYARGAVEPSNLGQITIAIVHKVFMFSLLGRKPRSGSDKHFPSFGLSRFRNGLGAGVIGLALVFAAYPTCAAPRVIGRIALGTSASPYSIYGIGINPKTNKLYVAGHASIPITPFQSRSVNQLKVVDVATKTVLSTIDTSPGTVAVNSATNTVYVTSYGLGDPAGGPYIAIIDGVTNSLVGRIPVQGYSPMGL